jgi:OOP family OmpA-OmpF porin
MIASDNFISVSQNFLSPDIVQKIGDLIGQSADKTKAGLKSVIPELLTGIVNKGSTPEGAAKLVDMVNTHNFDPNAKPDASKLSEGNEVVNNIFGSNLNNVVTKLGTSTGLSSASITKMLGLAAPTIMGVIGSKVKNDKMGSSGLMNFLTQQKNILSGFTSRANPVSMNGNGLSNMINAKSGTFQREVSEGLPWKKIILAALIALGAWFWWVGSQKQIAPTISRTIDLPAPIAKILAPLPTVNELSAFLTSGAASALPKHFRFEKLTFATGTTALAAGAEAELDEIASVLNANPMATARLEGYTDNVGQADLNQSLSGQRAMAVKDQLVARGVDENRLQIVGMGSANPIADNATAEGRAKNRRIEFVVTKIK